MTHATATKLADADVLGILDIQLLYLQIQSDHDSAIHMLMARVSMVLQPDAKEQIGPCRKDVTECQSTGRPALLSCNQLQQYRILGYNSIGLCFSIKNYDGVPLIHRLQLQ